MRLLHPLAEVALVLLFSVLLYLILLGGKQVRQCVPPRLRISHWKCHGWGGWVVLWRVVLRSHIYLAARVSGTPRSCGEGLEGIQESWGFGGCADVGNMSVLYAQSMELNDCARLMSQEAENTT